MTIIYHFVLYHYLKFIRLINSVQVTVAVQVTEKLAF